MTSAAVPSVTCPNCDTALPRGCGGVFKDSDGDSCWLNRPEKAEAAKSGAGTSVKRGRFVWVVYDPKGQPRKVFLSKPDDPGEACAWIYAYDTPDHSNLSIETPRDSILAHKAGYRLRRRVLS